MQRSWSRAAEAYVGNVKTFVRFLQPHISLFYINTAKQQEEQPVINSAQKQGSALVTRCTATCSAALRRKATPSHAGVALRPEVAAVPALLLRPARQTAWDAHCPFPLPFLPDPCYVWCCRSNVIIWKEAATSCFLTEGRAGTL